MTITDKGTEMADEIISILKASPLFDADDVWYGDSDHIPRVPAATVTAGGKTRELAGATFRTDVVQVVDIMVYTAKLDDSQQVQKDADELIEDVEALLHQYPDLNGLVVHGFVNTVEPGFALRNTDDIMRAAMLQWRGYVKTRIGT